MGLPHRQPDHRHTVAEYLAWKGEDRLELMKKHLYERFGVLEYLIVDVGTRFAEHLVLEGDRYGEARIVEEGEPLALLGLPLAGTLGELLDGRL